MTGRLPERFDPREAAREGLAGTGAVPVAAMPRLAPLLVRAAGEAQVALAACRDPAGWCVIEGRVTARVEAPCQRCLEPMTLALDAPVALAVVESDAQAGQLPEAYEPLEVPPGAAVALATLVEDELLLALPAYVRHPEGQCQAAGLRSPPGREPRRPFAALERLRRY